MNRSPLVVSLCVGSLLIGVRSRAEAVENDFVSDLDSIHVAAQEGSWSAKMRAKIQALAGSKDTAKASCSSHDALFDPRNTGYTSQEMAQGARIAAVILSEIPMEKLKSMSIVPEGEKGRDGYQAGLRYDFKYTVAGIEIETYYVSNYVNIPLPPLNRWEGRHVIGKAVVSPGALRSAGFQIIAMGSDRFALEDATCRSVKGSREVLASTDAVQRGFQYALCASSKSNSILCP